MAMADRPEVPVASIPLTIAALVGLGASIIAAVLTVPFRRPWKGPDTVGRNILVAVVREAMRAFMGYAVTLRTPELRGVEGFIDRLLRPVLPALARRKGVVVEWAEVGGVPGIWYRPEDRKTLGTILYLHGGGYLATTPEMYGVFNTALAAASSCDLFVPDYRLAPEFPFPAGLVDVTQVYEALLDDLGPDHTIVLAGDSGGGGLATSLVQVIAQRGLQQPRYLGLFSPQVSLEVGDGSMVTNADVDILPREIPVSAYLQGGIDPADAIVSAVNADPAQFPPMYVAVGGDEMFHDAIVRFVERARAAGVRTVLFDEPGMFHVYMILAPWMAASHRLYDDFGERFRAMREGRMPNVAGPLLRDPDGVLS